MLASAPTKPDIITIGKSLGAGLYPISAVLGSNSVMKVLTSGLMDQLLEVIRWLTEQLRDRFNYDQKKIVNITQLTV